MGFGGPVWHASASAATEAQAWAMAERTLRGVGDASLGEWREHGRRAVHIRRRVTDAERESVGGIALLDVRGTPEERSRITALLQEAPHLEPYLEENR